MKSDLNEILLPNGKMYKDESSANTFMKAVLLSALVFGGCFAFYRYESKLEMLESKVFDLALKVNELENNNHHHTEVRFYTVIAKNTIVWQHMHLNVSPYQSQGLV